VLGTTSLLAAVCIFWIACAAALSFNYRKLPTPYLIAFLKIAPDPMRDRMSGEIGARMFGESTIPWSRSDDNAWATYCVQQFFDDESKSTWFGGPNLIKSRATWPRGAYWSAEIERFGPLSEYGGKYLEIRNDKLGVLHRHRLGSVSMASIALNPQFYLRFGATKPLPQLSEIDLQISLFDAGSLLHQQSITLPIQVTNDPIPQPKAEVTQIIKSVTKAHLWRTTDGHQWHLSVEVPAHDELNDVAIGLRVRLFMNDRIVARGASSRYGSGSDRSFRIQLDWLDGPPPATLDQSTLTVEITGDPTLALDLNRHQPWDGQFTIPLEP